ncbi:hypothetical protein G3T14_10650 [Methylobacterium sp. BTF04]|uniref:hypothetical protein n=1 Tax=Methylobacterium sp. BTF04 TaxID=2708300 RepID=UPI0013D2EB6E|nr:hypothetical protein [Methylobacterium sp. BTF04]NEU12596.1 hypothetical protein [Methylobacterium sp. BTF04]
MNDKARAHLREMEHLADGWLVRWPGETEAFAIVVYYDPWPDDLKVRLHDVSRIDGMDTGSGEMDRSYSVLAATRHSASATWGGSANVGFQLLADDVWRERERIPAPDIDALMSLTR